MPENDNNKKSLFRLLTLDEYIIETKQYAKKKQQQQQHLFEQKQSKVLVG